MLDVDELISAWAVEVLARHWDSYSNNQNNFFFYNDPTSGQFHYIPWGPDSAFGGVDIFAREQAPTSLYAHSVLPHRLYALPSTRA